MDNLAPRVIYDTKINHKAKLIHNFTPKCAGSSVSAYLCEIAPSDWEEFPKINYLTDSKDIPDGYTIISTIRHPIPWMISGYRMQRQKGHIQMNFEEYCIWVAKGPSERYYNKHPAQFDDIWWHCGLLPDYHLVPGQKVFKLENIKELQKFIAGIYPHAKKIEFPVHNESFYDPKIKFTKKVQQAIRYKCGAYAQRFGYDLDFADRYIRTGVKKPHLL